MSDNQEPIIVEETYPSSINDTWNALTELDQMQQWFFDVLTDFKAEVGFSTKFTITHEGRVFPHIWIVKEVIENKKISVLWTFDGYPGEGLVTYELSESQSGTKLTLTDIVLQPFPDNIPEFKRESAVGGWNYFVKEQLKNYLSNK